MASFNDPNGDYNPYAPPAAVANTSSRDEDEVLILAERGTRWWARVIDQLLWVITFIPFALVQRTHEPVAPALAILGVVFFFYQCYLIATTGQTLAKKWMGIKVVKMDGSPCGFVSGVLLREGFFSGVGFLPVVGKFVSAADSLAIFGDQRRCMHDLVAGTKVVLAKNAR